METIRKIIAAITKPVITVALVAVIPGCFSVSILLGLIASAAILTLLYFLYKTKMTWMFIIGFYSFCLMIALYIFSAISKALSPDILITPTPPVPSGVDIAVIVSNSSIIFMS